MKSLFLSIVCMVFFFVLHAQQSVMPFKTFGGDQPDEFKHLIEMANSEIWAVGSTGSNLQGNSDVWLQITNEALDCIESKTFGSTGVDRAEYIVSDDLGNAYVVGYSNGFGALEYDALIVKLNSAGEEVWVKTIGNSDWDFATCAAWFNNELYVGGYTYLNAASSSAWLARLDEEGNLIEQWTFGENADAWMSDIRVTEDNHLLMMYTEYNSTSALHDVRIIKRDTSGAEVWTYLRSSVSEDSKGISFFEYDNIYFCAGTREINGLISPFVTHLSQDGIYMEEYQQEQPNDYSVVRALVTADSKTYAMSTRAFGGGGSDGGFLNFTPFYGYIGSVTMGGGGDDFINDAIITSTGKYIGCGEYNSFSGQLSQGMLVVLPDVNPEGYTYTLVDDAACFVVGIQENVLTEVEAFVGTWQIFDLSGRKISSLFGNEKQVQAQMALWPSGIYLLQAENSRATKLLIGH